MISLMYEFHGAFLWFKMMMEMSLDGERLGFVGRFVNEINEFRGEI
jgi:hypothetical protein